MTVQSSDFILKWLHQESLLGKLSERLNTVDRKYLRIFVLSSKGDILSIRNMCMVTHEGQAVFVNDSGFKSEFHFHVQFGFKN